MGRTAHDASLDPGGADPSREEILRAVDELVDERRAACLWFHREDFYPRTDRERIAVLEEIQERSGGAVFERAGVLKAWLSRHSSDGSASS